MSKRIILALVIFAMVVAIVCGMDVHAFAPADLPAMKFAEVSADTVPDDEEDVYFLLMSQAGDAIEAKDYEAAADRLNEALMVRPGSPSNALVLSNLGMVYSWLGRDSLSVDAYDRALDIAPAMVTVRNNRARQLLKMHRVGDAFNDFSEVIALDSLDTTARYYRGTISLFSGDAAACERDFAVLRSVAPDDITTCEALAMLYSMTGREREAIPSYRRLVELDPSLEYYVSLARCYLVAGELTDAGALLDTAFRRYGDDPGLLYCRAWLNRDRYRLDDARRDAKAALAAGADPAAVKALGVLK